MIPDHHPVVTSWVSFISYKLWKYNQGRIKPLLTNRVSIPYVQRHTDRRTSGARAGHGHQRRPVQERTDSKGLKTAADIWVTFPVPLILGWPKLFTDGQIFIICKWIKNCHFLSFEALFNTPGSSLKYHRATPTYTLFVVWYSILGTSNFETRRLCMAQVFESVLREF